MKLKKELRKKYLELRNNLSEEVVEAKSEKITQNLELLEIFKKAKNILFYYSVKNEVKTIELIKKYLPTKTIYLPKIISDHEFLPFPINSLSNLKRGEIGILEPEEDNRNYIDKIDLVIVPGVVFDRHGNRLGMGGGYYDRFLKKIKKEVPKIALSFDEQILDNLPNNPYDVPVDFVITDKKIY